MGKHKNMKQEEIFLKFMEQHKDLARGFMKGDRVIADALWENLKNDLNSHGPPQKDTTGWKKVWTDWKSAIRKKLSHNKSEDVSTGGGPFNKFVLSATEDIVVKICGIYTVVEGIPDTLDFTDEIEQENLDPNISVEAWALESETGPSSHPRAKKRKIGSVNNDLEDHIAKQTKVLEQIGETLEDLVAASSKRTRAEKDIDHTLRKLQKAVERIQKSLESKDEETRRHNHEMEKFRKEEIVLRLREIELEEMKMNLKNPNEQL